MTRKSRTILVLAIATISLGIACLFSLPKSQKSTLAHVYMLNIGQGDSFLIQAANGRQLLIDGGRDATVLGELAKVMPTGDKSIDVVIATHPDADHIGGLPFVLKHYDVGLFLTSQVMTGTQTFKNLFDELNKDRIPSYYARAGMKLTLDSNPNIPATFSVLFPDRQTLNWETNSASVVGRLQIRERSALFTGDSPSNIEHYLAQTDPKDIDVDILKLGHHGSKYSSGDEYLRATSPVLALISAGVNNRYGHPAPEVLARLKALSIPYVSTQDAGTVTLTTDGVKWYKK